MSAKDNRDPNQQRNLEEERREMRQQRPGTRPAWRSLWLWPVAVVLIGLLWWGFWGGGWSWNRRHEGANNVKPAPSNQLPAPKNGQPVTATKQNGNNGSQMLTADNKQPYIGQSLEIVRTPVLKKVSNSVFWLGAHNDAAPVLVVVAYSAQNAKNANLREGDSVNVVGQVQKAPPRQDAAQQWHLNQTGVQRLEHEGAYISASEAESLGNHKIQY